VEQDAAPPASALAQRVLHKGEVIAGGVDPWPLTTTPRRARVTQVRQRQQPPIAESLAPPQAAARAIRCREHAKAFGAGTSVSGGRSARTVPARAPPRRAVRQVAAHGGRPSCSPASCWQRRAATAKRVQWPRRVVLRAAGAARAPATTARRVAETAATGRLERGEDRARRKGRPRGTRRSSTGRTCLPESPTLAASGCSSWKGLLGGTAWWRCVPGASRKWEGRLAVVVGSGGDVVGGWWWWRRRRDVVLVRPEWARGKRRGEEGRSEVAVVLTSVGGNAPGLPGRCFIRAQVEVALPPTAVFPAPHGPPYRRQDVSLPTDHATCPPPRAGPRLDPADTVGRGHSSWGTAGGRFSGGQIQRRTGFVAACRPGRCVC